jgi:hypothetical protein
MLADRYKVFYRGHLRAFVYDPDQDLLMFVCSMCGAHSIPMQAEQPIPDTYRGIPHTLACPVIRHFEALYSAREAA